MKTRVLFLALPLIAGTINAQDGYEFTPQLLIETGVHQQLDTAKVGTLFVEKMEAGFELKINDKLSAMSNLELCEGNTIELNEAKAIYGFTERFSLSAGRLVTNFGSFTTDAIVDPRFKKPCETKQVAVQADFTGEHLFAGISVYNGIITNNFASFVPAIGFTAEKFDVKLAARSEFTDDNKNYTDLSLSGTISPTEKLRFVGELYTELNEKPSETDSLSTSQQNGSLAEIDFYPSQKWDVFTRADHTHELKSEFTTLMVQTGAGYHIAEQFRAALSIDMNGEKSGKEAFTWIPSLSAELRFEL